MIRMQWNRLGIKWAVYLTGELTAYFRTRAKAAQWKYRVKQRWGFPDRWANYEAITQRRDEP